MRDITHMQRFSTAICGHTFDWQERQESMALHTMSQEDVVHLLRELYHS